MSARNAGLNPASSPFFPSAGSNDHKDRPYDTRSGESRDKAKGFRMITRDQEASFASSTATADYESARSSPSPPSESTNQRQVESSPLQMLHSVAAFRSPPLNSDKPFAIALAETKAREASLMGGLETLLESPIATPVGPNPASSYNTLFKTDGMPPSSTSTSFMRQYDNDKIPTPLQATAGESSRSSSVSQSFPPESPASSLEAFGQNTVHLSYESFDILDAQLKKMPFIVDLLDRVARCELATRELSRELGDVQRRVDQLVNQVDRHPASHLGSMASTIQPSKPEFNNPFAASHAPSNANADQISAVSPHQISPTDDISQISQRLNTLTSSVGQLLALQTQQYPLGNHGSSNSSPSSGGQNVPESRSQLSNNNYRPHRHSEAPMNHPLLGNPSATPSMLGYRLPNRPEARGPSRSPVPPQTRTWSVGNLDLTARSNLGITNIAADAVLKQRRSVTTGMGMGQSSHGRRDSNTCPEISNEAWAAKDGGPIISKWEQLSLAPDLLRSLAKFGVGPPNKIQQRALPFLLRGSDIIAQAPPTQERIAAYVIPAIQVAVVTVAGRAQISGPVAIIISTTVDQATQAQRMIRDLGGPIGIRSALGVGATSNSNDLANELFQLQQNIPHIICGTPQKLHALFTMKGGLSGDEVRFLVLDEVDQLIARNLHDFVFNIVKLLPLPRSRGSGLPSPGTLTHQASSASLSGDSSSSLSSNTPLPIPSRRFSTVVPRDPSTQVDHEVPGPERQTALFSNTVPQDVLNLASAIQLREPVRVLVRRDGNVTAADSSQGSRGLRQFYLYLAFTAGSGRDPMSNSSAGLGIIGSGRGASNAEGVQAREWKLDALADLFEDIDVPHAIIHVGGLTALETVLYKLASRGHEAIPLHGDMNAGARMTAMTKFKALATASSRPPSMKVLVVYDVQFRTQDFSYVPFIVNYDLPKAVEEYAHRVAPAISSGYSRAGVVVNFVTATGGDVEMLRSIECFYKIKCPEVPMSLRDIF